MEHLPCKIQDPWIQAGKTKTAKVSSSAARLLENKKRKIRLDL